MLKKYVKTKPTQALLMLIVLAWSVYEIGATSIANNEKSPISGLFLLANIRNQCRSFLLDRSPTRLFLPL